MHFAIQPAYAISGLLVGLLVGLTGVGGGSLMTPLLVLLFGFHPSTAVGTDLLFASIAKVAGTTIHSAGKSVDWKIVGRLAAEWVLKPSFGLILAIAWFENAVDLACTEPQFRSRAWARFLRPDRSPQQDGCIFERVSSQAASGAYVRRRSA